ncbi:RepB family plasmid replication initiator protein (plasmid) [Ligilactobacillus salivarius]|uniref:RepB family plasmid replication initiator protein n=1 Tax=Ligilactobacillus salivarius TaxID=1624 RepID=UPI0017847A93|nr:RepB family plasmid replication initiator protein [Ligilactobacillus salivarius]QXL50653.1 RepB family plasmid replication initiator protein [Ligilactobacillus salivarius]
MELEKKKVVEHNDLIKSSAKMDVVPLKIFELAVSEIDTFNPPKDNTIYLSKKELFKFLDVDDSNKNYRFRQAISKMQKQAFFEIREEKGKGYVFRNIVPIPYVEWNSYSDSVKIRFDVEIMPYLTELKTNFTQFALTDIQGLNSKHSIIIYKWLNMNYNQFEYYKKNGNRDGQQLYKLCNPVIEVDELRWLTNTQKEYVGRFTNFELYVIKKPIKEINKYTRFNVTYDKIREGRKITKIQFHISLKGEKTIEDSSKSKKVVTLANAQQSPYSQLLMGALLITFNDMQNETLMLSLAAKIYPKYDEFVEKYSLDILKKHLEYVKAHSTNIKDLVTYLDNALEDYQKRLVGQEKDNKESKPKNRKKGVVQKEKIPDYISNPGKNKLTQKGIDNSKDVDKLLAKINKDLK